MLIHRHRRDAAGAQAEAGAGREGSLEEGAVTQADLFKHANVHPSGDRSVMLRLQRAGYLTLPSYFLRRTYGGKSTAR